MVSFGMKLTFDTPEDWVKSNEFFQIVESGMNKKALQMSFLKEKKLLRLGNTFYFSIPIAVPEFYWGGLVLLFPLWLFKAPIWLYIIAGLIFSTGFVWSARYYYLLGLLRLKRMGYKGRAEFVSSNKALEELILLWGK